MHHCKTNNKAFSLCSECIIQRSPTNVRHNYSHRIQTHSTSVYTTNTRVIIYETVKKFPKLYINCGRALTTKTHVVDGAVFSDGLKSNYGAFPKTRYDLIALNLTTPPLSGSNFFRVNTRVIPRREDRPTICYVVEPTCTRRERGIGFGQTQHVLRTT